MELKVNYLNNEYLGAMARGEKPNCTWYAKEKTYTSEQMDEDMKVCVISHVIDYVELNNVRIVNKSQVKDLIEFLKNLEPALYRK